MPNTKISEDPSASALVGDELIPTVQGGVNKSMTPDQIKAYTNAGLPAPGISAVEDDTSPTLGGNLDADENKIENLGAPTGPADATTKSYVDTAIAGITPGISALVEDTNPVLGGDLNGDAFFITNVGGISVQNFGSITSETSPLLILNEEELELPNGAKLGGDLDVGFRRLVNIDTLVFKEIVGAIRSDTRTLLFLKGDDLELPNGAIVTDGTFDMDGNAIENLPEPTEDHHAATKKYVDDNSGGGGTVPNITNTDDGIEFLKMVNPSGAAGLYAGSVGPFPELRFADGVNGELQFAGDGVTYHTARLSGGIVTIMNNTPSTAISLEADLGVSVKNTLDLVTGVNSDIYKASLTVSDDEVGGTYSLSIFKGNAFFNMLYNLNDDQAFIDLSATQVNVLAQLSLYGNDIEMGEGRIEGVDRMTLINTGGIRVRKADNSTFYALIIDADDSLKIASDQQEGDSVTIGGTVSFPIPGGLSLPNGLTVERHSTPTNGMIRYNNETNEFEGYKNGGWVTFNTTPV